jgi:agmatine deiminase
MSPRHLVTLSSRHPRTPASLGFSFPAEWEKHEGTWLSWPRPEGISFPGKYHTVPENMARIIHEIAKRENVHINVPNENYERIVRAQIVKSPANPAGVPSALLNRRVSFHFIKTNESWCRDHGPAFLVQSTASKSAGKQSSNLAIVDWAFNAWGGKYPPFDSDDAVPTEISKITRTAAGKPLPLFTPDLVMEGGSVDFNGKGTVLTTEQCLLNKNRNPGKSRGQIEKYLKDYYGQSHVVWLGEGIEGDDTDGHVDDLARFIDATTIVIGMEPDPKEANYKPLQEARRRLELAKDQDGRRFTIVEMPMPGRVEHDGQRLPATYVNFYFVNGAVLLPTYRSRKQDAKAAAVLAELLPRKEIVPIDCWELIWGLGSIHCLTQQVPRGVRVVAKRPND